MKIVDYRVVRSYRFAGFEDDVLRLIKEGYELQGGVSITEDPKPRYDKEAYMGSIIYTQALVLRGE